MLWHSYKDLRVTQIIEIFAGLYYCIQNHIPDAMLSVIIIYSVTKYTNIILEKLNMA